MNSIFWPKISLITPSYNHGKYLEETILSVIEQDYPNLEYILIDGGSTDGSTEIIKRYHSHFYHWESAPDKGQANAINRGFKKSSGEIFGWLNSDDLLKPGALRDIAKYFLAFPKVDFVYGNRIVINEDSVPIGKKDNIVLPKFLLRYGSPFAQETTFWRRRVWDEAGSLNEQFQFCMDYEFYCRIVSKYRFGYLPKFLGSFRIHSQSKTSKQKEIQKLEDEKIQNMYFSNTTRISEESKRLVVSVVKYLSIYSGYYQFVRWYLENRLSKINP
jgi:glycosyltransferase involved in cell wall biosynthesis